MRAVLQRVLEGGCRVNGESTGAISRGLVVLLGIEQHDTEDEVVWLAQKIVNMRIFGDEAGLMNRSVLEVPDSGILLISQFTLYAQTKKGNRPSFIRAAKPDKAIPLYELMIRELEKHLGKKIQTGIFGADMKISLINDGPVTIMMDTRDRDNF